MRGVLAALLLHLSCCTCLAIRNFTPGAFVIRRLCGQVGFATETEWDYYGAPRNPLDPNQPRRTVEQSGVSVRLFDAKLDDGTRVLLKEFVGDARAIAANELKIYELLYQRAEDAGQPPPSQLGRLIGRMTADRSFGSPGFIMDWERALPTVPPPSTDGLWLAFAWDSLLTMASFPSAEQPPPSWLFDRDGAKARAQRMRFVKLASQRALETVGWLHGQGVVHRSLGGSSLLLSTYDQTSEAREIGVRAIDLGFAATSSSLPPEEVSAALSRGAKDPLDVIPFLTQADDLHALGYVLLELALASSASASASAATGGGGDAPPAPACDLQSLKRLVEDVFGGDVAGGFRGYAKEEKGWGAAVDLLDEGGVDGRAGWQLLQALVDCRDVTAARAARESGVSAAGLLESAWFGV